MEDNRRQQCAKMDVEGKRKQQEDSCRMDMEVCNMEKCAGWIWKSATWRSVQEGYGK